MPSSVTRLKKLQRTMWSFLLTVALCACNQGESDAPHTGHHENPSTNAEKVDPTASTMTAVHLWSEGADLLNEAAVQTELLNTQVLQLLELPSPETLQLAQQSWLQSAIAIERFHPFSRLGLTNAHGFKALLDLQNQLASWPIQPGYLDAFGPHQYSGIVFDISTPLQEQSLRDQHGLTNYEDATLGIYSIEFMLFGELDDRDYRVFLPKADLSAQDIETGYKAIAELPNNRRRQLLRLQSEILTKDIARLVTLWANPQPDSVSALFRQRSLEQQQLVLNQAIQNTLTEQILAVAEQQKDSVNNSHQQVAEKDKRLLRRIQSQLAGVIRLAEHSPLQPSAAFVPQSQRCTTIESEFWASDEEGDLAQESDQAFEAQRNEHWKAVYSCIRELTRALDPAYTPSPGEETETHSA